MNETKKNDKVDRLHTFRFAVVCYLEKLFEEYRFSEYHHLGLGDIRLTIAQQDDIIESVKKILTDK